MLRPKHGKKSQLVNNKEQSQCKRYSEVDLFAAYIGLTHFPPVLTSVPCSKTAQGASLARTLESSEVGRTAGTRSVGQ